MMRKDVFNSRYFALAIKANAFKSGTTHLFQNDQLRGLARVWEDDRLGLSAHASIESLNQEWSVGFYLRNAGTSREEVLNALAAVLVDFRFEDRAFPDKPDLIRLIAEVVESQQPVGEEVAP